MLSILFAQENFSMQQAPPELNPDPLIGSNTELSKRLIGTQIALTGLVVAAWRQRRDG